MRRLLTLGAYAAILGTLAIFCAYRASADKNKKAVEVAPS